MIEIVDQEYFDEVKQFAETTGRGEQLQKKLNYLDTYAENGDRGATRCILGKDFAPHSFAFLIQKRDDSGEYKYWFNGGLIFHSDHNRWGVHT
jgi:hypothetical protein